MEEKRREPPFDGEPCPMCPVEVRNLHATAFNLKNAYERWREYPCSDHHDRFVRKLHALFDAVEQTQPLADAHFADRGHSHG